MSAISLKSITGITSITTPAGVDNQLTLHNNNTTEAVKLDIAGNLHFHNHLNITGVSTASNFKTGTSNLHNTGLNVFDLDVDGHTNLDNVSVAGVTTIAHTGANQLIIKDSDTSGDNAHMRISFQDSGGTEKFFVGNNNSNGWLYLGSPSGQNNNIAFRVNGQDKFQVNGSGAYVNGALTVAGNADIADSIIHTGDTNTKIRFPASDTISFETGGSERLRIDSNGKIGVGGAPSAWQAATTTKALQIGNSCLFNYNDTYFHLGQNFYFDGSNYKLINNGWASRLMQNDGQFKFLVSDASGSADANISWLERVRIDSSGRMMIGTTTEGSSASDDFTIASTGTTGMTIRSGTSNNGNIEFSDGTSGQDEYRGVVQYAHSDNSMRFYTNATEKLRIDSSGRMMIGTTTEGVSTGDKFTIATSSNTGMTIRSGTSNEGNIFFSDATSGSGEYAGSIQYNHGSNFLTIGTNTIERLRINSSGAVMINTTNSSSRTLNLNGTFGILSASQTGVLDMSVTDGGEASIGPYVAGGSSLIFKTNSSGAGVSERLRINQHGTITNTTSSSHSQGAGTFNIKGVINQYSQGSGSGLIFDCDFGRLTGYGDDTNVGDGTNLSACLAHSTTDWVSNNSNLPISVNGGTFQYRVGFGGYMEGISNGGRVSVGAGSGSPNMAHLLNTAAMTIETWCWYDGTGREVLVSRYGSGFPNNFNMLCDPNGQFHYNSAGAGAGSGNVSGEHFPDKTWHHHLWQYESGVHRWYINGAFANSRTGGSSVAVSSSTGFGIFSRADRYEDFRGKIAIVRIYNRALSATEIKNHFELERGRFGV